MKVVVLLFYSQSSKYVNKPQYVREKMVNSPHLKRRVSVRPQYIMGWGWHITEIQENIFTSIGDRGQTIANLPQFTKITVKTFTFG